MLPPPKPLGQPKALNDVPATVVVEDDPVPAEPRQQQSQHDDGAGGVASVEGTVTLSIYKNNIPLDIDSIDANAKIRGFKKGKYAIPEKWYFAEKKDGDYDLLVLVDGEWSRQQVIGAKVWSAAQSLFMSQLIFGMAAGLEIKPPITGLCVRVLGEGSLSTLMTKKKKLFDGMHVHLNNSRNSPARAEIVKQKVAMSDLKSTRILHLTADRMHKHGFIPYVSEGSDLTEELLSERMNSYPLQTTMSPLQALWLELNSVAVWKQDVLAIREKKHIKPWYPVQRGTGWSRGIFKALLGSNFDEEWWWRDPADDDFAIQLIDMQSQEALKWQSCTTTSRFNVQTFRPSSTPGLGSTDLTDAFTRQLNEWLEGVGEVLDDVNDLPSFKKRKPDDGDGSTSSKKSARITPGGRRGRSGGELFPDNED